MADMAWAAAVLDCLGSWRVHQRYSPPGGGGSYSPRVVVRTRQVVQRPLLERMQELYGGSISRPAHKNQGPPQWEWAVSGAKSSAAVTEAVLPYLWLKHRRAAAHLRLCRQILAFKRPSFADRDLPRAEIQARNELFRAFNRTR
jgi:hypothetical protein